MPIYEYQCSVCQHEFETLVLKHSVAECPKCGSVKLERQISLAAIKSESTRGLAMKAAKKRDQKQGADNARAQREYELHHND